MGARIYSDGAWREAPDATDYAARLTWARQTGGPALHRLSFSTRAQTLKALAESLREALPEVADRLAALAARGRRELPDAPFILSGEAEAAGKGGPLRQALLTPRDGVAVQAHAAEASGRDLADSLGLAILAGVPAIVVVPESAAALVEALVGQLADANTGLAAQWLIGPVEPLLGGLSPADLLVSIGSAAEAARLRRHPSLAESGARLHAETPGSGAAVLGPDVDAASPEFALFVEAAERQPGRPRLVPRARLQDVRQSRAGDGASRLHVYDDLEAAAAQLAIGSAAELFSHEPATAVAFMAAAAPRLARIAVVDRDSGPAEVSESFIARLEPYLNRSVVQASPAMLGAIIDRHLPGAPITTGPEHPFRKRFGELALGYSLKTGARTITLEDIEHFAHFTGDTFYAHMDEEAAKASPIFGGRVAHGYLILAFAAGLFVDPPPGPVLANYGLDNLRFVKPMRPGDSLAVTLTVKSKTRRNAQMGEVRWGVTAVNQNGEVTATYDLLTMNAV